MHWGVIMATINYYGLTKKGTVTVDLTVTIDQLITAIATDEVLATEYYTVSAMNDFGKSSLTYGDSSTTLTQLGLVDDGTVLCTTNQTGSKQERQVAKLAIAGQKRSLSGRTSTLTIDNLPTKYTGNAVTDNANSGGLVAGRPWTTASGDTAGLYRTTYTGYFADDPAFFATATVSSAAVNLSPIGDGDPGFEPFSVQLLGYFKPTTTETHTFFLNSDDASYMWIGATAVSGFTTANAFINNGSVHGSVEVSASIALTAGVYYPIRIQMGDQSGGDVLDLNYSTPTIVKTTTVTGKIFYNSATNGF